MVVYVDDMLVKNKEEVNHAKYIAACFQIMEKYNMRLKPKKCAFAIKGGKFMGYMVTSAGI